MKGIVLAGGLGSRLRPLTNVTNKHLLPVYDRPMIFWPLQTLHQAGINEVMMVIGGKSTESLVKLCKDGREFGFKRLYYAYQEGEGGIASALELTEEFVGREDCCVILGDTILLNEDVAAYTKTFLNRDWQKVGAQVALKFVSNPREYGVAEFGPDLAPSAVAKMPPIKKIHEKPKQPPSDAAVIGFYYYDSTVFSKIRSCVPSRRGELEITDVNNAYAEEGKLDWTEVQGSWFDAGSSISDWLSVGKAVESFMRFATQKEEYIELVRKG
jgi:glucose-1-phosphate thymidylyltransferase